MLRKYRFVLDADGVLLDFDRAWRGCAERVLDRRLEVVEPVYDLGARYGLPAASVAKAWAAWEVTEGWRRVPPIQEGIGAARMLLDMGHSVTVLTCLPNEYAEQQRRWCLDRWGLSGAQMIAVRATKKGGLSLCRPHFFADDRLVHCVEARDVMVPFIARIRYCEQEDTPDGIHEFGGLEEAVGSFFRQVGYPLPRLG